VIDRGSRMIDTDVTKVGQIRGLIEAWATGGSRKWRGGWSILAKMKANRKKPEQVDLGG